VFDCSPDGVPTIVDPRGAAEAAALRYVSDARPGIGRNKAGTGFSYTRADGSKLTERDVLRRIKALAIPPAWTDVWICPFADGHIQAPGATTLARNEAGAGRALRHLLTAYWWIFENPAPLSPLASRSSSANARSIASSVL
jgi:hypothetical protein